MKDAPSSANGVRVATVCAIDLSVRQLLRPQIDALNEAGHRAEAVCSDGPYVAELREQGVVVQTLPISRAIAPLRDLWSVIALWRLFRRRRYAVVHTHTPKAAFLGQVAAALAGVPVRVNTIHGLYYPAAPPGLRRTAYKRLEVIACRLASHVFSQSAEDVELLRRERLVASAKLEWLGNGVDLTRFDPARFDAGEGRRVRAALDVPAGAFVVGIVARMVTEKGFAELFEAFAALRRSAPDAYLLHIGFVDRSRNDEVTPELAARHGVAGYCRFVGQREDVARLMTAMDVYCLPSYREGYPRSVLEANAMGLPAVVTDIRGCREAVIDGVNGLLVPPRQVAPLAAALRRLRDDTDLRRRLGEAARRRAEEAFDERRVIGRVLATYERLLRERGLRRRPAPPPREASAGACGPVKADRTT